MKKSIEKDTDKNPFVFDGIDKALVFSLFFIGLFLIIFGQKGKPIAEWIFNNPTFIEYVLLICREVGVTAVVASIVILTIEKFLKRKQFEASEKFKEQLSEDVLSAVFKRIVPDIIYKEIKTAVLESTIMKTNSVMTYRLTEPNADDLQGVPDSLKPEIIKVFVTTSHTIKNCGHRELDHSVKCGVSCDLGGALGQKVKIEHCKIGTELVSNLNAACTKIDGDSGLKFEKLITIKPGDSVDIEFTNVTFKRRKDSEIWTTVVPTEGMELRLISDRFETFARALHTSTIVEINSHHALDTKTFRLNAGVFPHQGIAFWWREKTGS